MKQAEFESRHQSFWSNFEELVNNLATADSESITRFPQSYRRVCQHHAVAKSRRYASSLSEKLNGLVQQGYLALYAGSGRKGVFLDFIFYGFPTTLRANAKYLWIATGLFVVPAILMAIACLLNDQIIYSLMDAANVRSFESMYDPELGKLGRQRQSDSDLLMFGFYIQNNIGVAFRCFATGIFAGIGSLYFIVVNGLILGGVAGHLSSLGYNETFYPFVIGHGSFELTAIVFSGAAGLKIGHALIAPGKYTRVVALQTAAADAIKIVYGVILMLLIAAFIEAFWSSSSSLSVGVKVSVGSFLWFLVIYYCFINGRVRRAT